MRNGFLISSIVVAFSCTAVAGASGQSATPPHPVIVTVPAANPADVGSIDAIIMALYDVISGPAGQARDWNRMRSLFIPGCRLMPAGPRPTGGIGIRLFEVNDYIALSGA
ncbi:hypothetical protein BH23GEM8_BH23GEM8_09860 [soil metagenome]